MEKWNAFNKKSFSLTFLAEKHEFLYITGKPAKPKQSQSNLFFLPKEE